MIPTDRWRILASTDVAYRVDRIANARGEEGGAPGSAPSRTPTQIYGTGTRPPPTPTQFGVKDAGLPEKGKFFL